jgi:PBP1b-binding outer membrane lipoprotein LpoB
MKKEILTIALLTALFLTSCKQSPKQENVEAPSKETVEKLADEIITDSITDKEGRKLEISFNESKNTATLKLDGKTIEMTIDSTKASGSNYKSEHYQYTQWHNLTIVEKDGEKIFEAGVETMPK